MNFNHEFRIIVVGDYETGKTSLIKRITNDKFDIKSMIDNTEYEKIIKKNEKNIKLKFCDINGNEKNQTIKKPFYNNSNAALIVFDLTEINSFRNITFWIEKTIQNTKLEFIILIGTKVDLSLNRCIDDEIIQNYCQNHKSNNIIYIETSAKTGKNINSICDIIIDNIFLYKSDKPKKIIDIDTYYTSNDNIPMKTNYNTFDNMPETIRLIPHNNKSKFRCILERYMPCFGY